MTDPKDTEIARYNLTGYDRGTEAAHEGAWVRHSDHAAEIARLHQQWEDHDAAWSERVAVLTAALAESEAAAEGALMILVQTQAERDAALAQVARLHHLIREASDPDFLWGAMDNVNDMDADITEFAKAASRAIQASIPDPDAILAAAEKEAQG